MAFSVQGIVEAADLLLTKVSGDRQTKPTGNTFEITFAVEERSNTTPIRNTNNQLVNESGDNRINSSGYKVALAENGTVYRLIDSLVARPPLYRAEVPADNEDDDNNYTQLTITTLSTASATTGLFMTGATGIGSVVDTKGRAVYTDTDLRIGATGMAAAVSLSKRYYYNQETVTITDQTGQRMTFALKGAAAGRPIPEEGLMEVPGINPNALQGNITLVCTPPIDNPEGTYTVRIQDATPVPDTPWTAIGGGLPNPVPAQRTFIEFTLYVTNIESGRTIMLNGDGRILSSGINSEEVNTRFTFNVLNQQVHYQVTKGNGTLYVGNLDTQYTTPAKDLETHGSSSVYLIMNNTTNEVTVAFAGQDPATHGREGSICIYWDRGSH